MLHQMVKVGNAVEYSIELVVVGEDMCVFEILFKLHFVIFVMLMEKIINPWRACMQRGLL